jgi:hypothetical protein
VASGTVQQADQRDPDTGVVGFLADLLRVYRVRLEAYAVVQFHRTDVPKRRLDMRDLGRAEAQQIGVACRTMRDVEPQVEQQRTFQQELVGVGGDAEPVKQALKRIAGQDQIEVLPGLAGAVEQAGAHRGGHVALVHDRLSM